jgi:hypothetical protein
MRRHVAADSSGDHRDADTRTYVLRMVSSSQASNQDSIIRYRTAGLRPGRVQQRERQSPSTGSSLSFADSSAERGLETDLDDEKFQAWNPCQEEGRAGKERSARRCDQTQLTTAARDLGLLFRAVAASVHCCSRRRPPLVSFSGSRLILSLLSFGRPCRLFLLFFFAPQTT